MPLDVDHVRREFPGRHIEWHRVLDSTMRRASRLAIERYACGTVVGADEQFAGQGRLGRSWHSEPESGLYQSVILRYRFPADALPVVTLALGLAAAEAIEKAAGVGCDLRWPNDVMVGRLKCAGILTQLEGDAVIAGIGINVNHAAFPDDIAEAATSLRLASGREHAREGLLIELLRCIDEHCGTLERDGREPVLRTFAHVSSYVRGRRVMVDLNGSMVTGTTAGLDEFGFLLLDGEDGRRHQVIAGGVRPCS